MDGQRLGCNRVGILERGKMKVKYEDIQYNMFHYSAIALETAIKYYDREIDTQFLKRIAKTTVEAFLEFYEIDNKKSAMEKDMRQYLKVKLYVMENKQK